MNKKLIMNLALVIAMTGTLISASNSSIMAMEMRNIKVSAATNASSEVKYY